MRSISHLCMFPNQSPLRLHMMHSQKLWTLRWRSFSEWSSDRVVYYFAKEGCQYIGYGKQRPGHFSITVHTRLKIVDIPLTLIFRMGQWSCCSLFCQRRLPVHWLWKAAARSLFNYRTYKTKNRWCSVDAHFNVLSSQDLLPFIIAFILFELSGCLSAWSGHGCMAKPGPVIF